MRTPKINARVEPEVYARLCLDYGMELIPVYFEQTSSEKFYGHYFPDSKTIKVYVGLRAQGIDRIRFVTHQLARTLLHEFRHAWQYANWDYEEVDKAHRGGYWRSKIETDAREFADERLGFYPGLVVVRRPTTSSLSRLSQAEGRARAAA